MSSLVSKIWTYWGGVCCSQQSAPLGAEEKGEVLVPVNNVAKWSMMEDPFSKVSPGLPEMRSPAVLESKVVHTALCEQVLCEAFAEEENLLEDIPSEEKQPDAALTEMRALRELLKVFVQDMVHGKSFNAVQPDGSTLACELVMTPNLATLSLHPQSGRTVEVLVKDIMQISPGCSPQKIWTSIPLDDRCNTLILRNKECITFRFDDVEARDEFTRCMKVIRLAVA